MGEVRPDHEPPPALSCLDLSVGYGSRIVLRGVSLDILPQPLGPTTASRRCCARSQA